MLNCITKNIFCYIFPIQIHNCASQYGFERSHTDAKPLSFDEILARSVNSTQLSLPQIAVKNVDCLALLLKAFVSRFAKKAVGLPVNVRGNWEISMVIICIFFTIKINDSFRFEFF